MASTAGSVRMERRGFVFTITLARPETGNAVDGAMAEALREASQQAVEADDCHVLVLASTGGVFCSGAAPMADPLSDIPRLRVADALAAIPKPVIAAIQGDALGQGLELALACDLRIAADSAHFAMDQVRGGLIPWDGGSQRLPRLVSRGIALEMLLTGRTVTALEALAAGLVSEVEPMEQVLARAQQVADALAQMAPIAASYVKEAMLKGMDMPLDQALRLETDLAVLLHSSRDRAEGIRSFLEKRKPRFTGA